ncbi:crotonobetainyl-CoA:carnitine CoA-transferase CaiB-like acyl-CoA transferase [Rhodococcus wratislaviensis]|uniref:CoA-transferase family iii n=1 Tax=Rhodococcus wratislaviensis TaxID=44752 RepID=A0AB38FDA0_RHOWR|nr:CoA transferase [Rhodococcus wratislaviensis]REE75481.1 crotonobetainyl-CoA:carnitine CoA-transferase CaiB-like acyl-CoA transferase [Rhodococcus wratislaviensis]SPZ39484.1 CoA-transferase family iii [Rhodococcus wratislaviensis]
MSVSHESTTSTELADLVVVEIGTGLSGAFAARILGDFGAAVTKIEPPGGDPLRDPSWPGGLDGLLFEYLNWNKRSAVLDLGDSLDRDRLRERIRTADIVVTSLDPAQARSLGLTPADLRSWTRQGVVVSVTGFGSDGPYADLAATELIVQALGGVMSISGATEREPVKRGLRQSTYYAGLNAAYAAMAGVYASRTSGESALIDVAVRDCVAAELVMNQSLYAFLGVLQSRPPATADPFGGYPLPCADGFVTVQASTAAPMCRLAELFGEPALTLPRYASKERRTALAGELREILAPHLEAVAARELFVDASKDGFLVGVVQDASQMLGCDQLEARGAFQSFPNIAGHTGDPMRFPASLGRFSGWRETVPTRRAPRLGEESQSTSDVGDAAGAARPGEPALDQLRVLDLSQVFAGPYLGGLLADFGADVVKIESPYRLDQARTDYGGYFDNDPGEDPWNRTSTFQVINRGKRAISLDLKSERGTGIFRRLVAGADIVIENFTPGVLARLGLGYEALRKINPRLIMLSNSGFGSTGPWSGFKAQGTTLEATMGISRYTGYHGGPPMKAGQSYPDFLATWTGLVGVFAALLGRQRTGRGQWIDLGMYELGVSVMPEAILRHQVDGKEYERVGNDEIDALASGVVSCAGDEEWLAFSATTDEQVQRLLRIVSGAAAVRGRDVGTAVAEWTTDLEAAKAARTLQEAGIAAGKVLDARDLLADPQLVHRGFYEVVDGFRDLSPRPIIGRPFTWSGGGIEVRTRGRAPRFAEHTTAVLCDDAGVSPDEVVADSRTGAVALTPKNPLPASANDYSEMLGNRSILSVGGAYSDVVADAVASLCARVPASEKTTAAVATADEHGGAQ